MVRRPCLPAPCPPSAVPGPGEDDEADLVARVRAGDEGACETLVRRHGGAMLSCARRFLRCNEDSADAVQEAFVAAFRSIDRFTGSAQLRTWLHRIVVNCCLMKLRRQRRQRTVSIHDLLPAFSEDGHHAGRVAPWAHLPEDALSRTELCRQVRDCIDQLPNSYREIILLRDIEGLETQATAELLGVSTGVVKTRLHRARQALRSLLEPLLAGAYSGTC